MEAGQDGELVALIIVCVAERSACGHANAGSVRGYCSRVALRRHHRFEGRGKLCVLCFKHQLCHFFGNKERNALNLLLSTALPCCFRKLQSVRAFPEAFPSRSGQLKASAPRLSIPKWQRTISARAPWSGLV